MVKRKPDPSVLIKIAQKDFEAAKLLFERRLYPQAIYMLQQSLEKAIKASLLKLDIIETEEELREEIGHSATKRTLQLLVDEMPRRFMEFLKGFVETSVTISAQLEGELEKVWSELSLCLVELGTLSYKRLLEGRKDIFEFVEKVDEKIFDTVDEEFKMKMSDLIIVLLSWPPQLLEILLGRDEIRVSLKILKFFYQKEIDKLLTSVLLLAITFILMICHVPFEPPNVEILKYRREPESISEEVTIVWWSENIIKQLENTEMLKTLEKLIKEDFEDLKIKELLEASKRASRLSST